MRLGLFSTQKTEAKVYSTETPLLGKS